MPALTGTQTAPLAHRLLRVGVRKKRPAQGEKPAQQSSRAGFTIVEMLIAIVILSVGVLGLAATSAVVLRQMTGAKTQTSAAQIAASRVELLAGKVCGKLAVTGTATTSGVTESWTVAPSTNRTMTATVSVAFEGRTNPEKFQTVIACF